MNECPKCRRQLPSCECGIVDPETQQEIADATFAAGVAFLDDLRESQEDE